MKCPNCNETKHEPTAKFCHVCGVKLGKSSHNIGIHKKYFQSESYLGNEKGALKDDISGYARKLNNHIEESTKSFGVVMILAWVIPIICIPFLISHYRTHTYEYVDSVSVIAWQNRPFDPNKYDYLLNNESKPEPITGTLIVDSSPQGVDIYLDGKDTGLTTPATIKGIEEGEHTISLESDRIQIKNKWYQISQKIYSIEFDFEKRMPYVKLH